MEILLIICISLLMAICLPKLSRWLYQLGDEMEEKKAQDKFYREQILSNVTDINTNLSSSGEDEPCHTSRLLEANKELLEKQRLRDAMRDELDIES